MATPEWEIDARETEAYFYKKEHTCWVCGVTDEDEALVVWYLEGEEEQKLLCEDCAFDTNLLKSVEKLK